MVSAKSNYVKKLLIAITVTTIVIIFFNYVPVFKAFELQALDFLITIKGEKKYHNKNIVLVVEDDETAAKYGWPMSRKFYAHLIDSLASYGARVVAFDFLFNDKTNPENDESLIVSSAKAGNIIHSFAFEVWQGEQYYDFDADSCGEQIYCKYSLKLQPSAKTKYYRASTSFFPYNDFMKVFNKAGHITIIGDEDGHFRRIPLIIYFEGCYYPALGFKITCEYLNITDKDINVEKSFGGYKIVLKSPRHIIKIPINKKGQMLLNFYGDINIFQQFSLYKVLQGLVPSKSFADKIVLVGKTITGDKDSFINPFSADFPGLGVHANFIANVLDKNYMRELSFISNAMILFFLTLIVITLYPYGKYQNKVTNFIFPIPVIVILVVIAYCFLKFEIGIYWIKIVQSSAAIILSFIGINILEKWESFKVIKEINNELIVKEQTLSKKDYEIEFLKWKLETLNKQIDNIKFFRTNLTDILTGSSKEIIEFLQHNFKFIFDNQNEIQSDLEKQLHSIENLKKQMDSEKQELEDNIFQLQKEKTKIKKTSIGSYKKIEIFTKEPKIIIEGSKGRTEKLRFPPQLMAFIYFLAKARLKRTEWIVNGVINEMKISEAKKASDIYGYEGVVGCVYLGDKRFKQEIELADFTPDPHEVTKCSHDINAKIKSYINNSPPLIRTPGSEHARDGRYYLVKNITDVIIHDNK